ncbi:Dabb family protein [Clavibacter tessellarius]|uniref:Dabb family protein n=1 Tax=Clavibacter tessellarius TaxID=31965 RepID=UPI00324AA2AC
MTLRHVVSWKLADRDPAALDRDAARAAEALGTLPALVPGIRSFQVGRDIVGSARSHDLVLIADFDDRAALDAYDAHPEHQRVAAVVRSLVSSAASVDFEV